MQTLSRTTQKARKEHICNLCGLPIRVGERYNKQSNINGGEFYEFKAHEICDVLAVNLGMYDEMYKDGLTGDSFRDCIWNEYLNIMSNQDNDHLGPKGFTYPSFKEQLDCVKNKSITL